MSVAEAIEQGLCLQCEERPASVDLGTGRLTCCELCFSRMKLMAGMHRMTTDFFLKKLAGEAEPSSREPLLELAKDLQDVAHAERRARERERESFLDASRRRIGWLFSALRSLW